MEKNSVRKKILHYAKEKSSEYTDSTSKFRDDEHILIYMLEAHLNPDTEAASSQHAFIQKSADWISGFAENPHTKTLLNLGFGAGIYAETFPSLGFSVKQYADFFENRHVEYEDAGFWSESPCVCMQSN